MTGLWQVWAHLSARACRRAVAFEKGANGAQQTRLARATPRRPQGIEIGHDNPAIFIRREAPGHCCAGIHVAGIREENLQPLRRPRVAFAIGGLKRR